MPTGPLHAALSAFAEEAAFLLAAATAEGDEVAFEVVESRGGRRATPLYCYRPLTGDFIDRRQGTIARLPTHLPAVHALARTPGLDAYLQQRVARGIPRDGRERAELALRAFLTRVFEESTDFALDGDRLQRAWLELEAIVGDQARPETVVIAPVLGLELVSDEIAMGDGLTLVRADALPADGPDAHLWAGDHDGAAAVAVLSWEAAAGDVAPLEHARIRLRRLVTALRLYDAAAPCLAPMAFARTAAGPWQLMTPAASSTGRPQDVCEIAAEQEDELRAFCSLVTRRTPRGGEVAWALRRFELASARPSPADALTDHLLALRALLEPEGPGAGRLPGRLAAICAPETHRPRLAERTEQIVAVEQALVSGAGVPEPETLAGLSDELGGHLRAILRDVLCGHLEPDVRALADRLIAAAADRQPTLA